MHKIMNPGETIAGGEHAYYKQKLQAQFGSKRKQNYEKQRDTEIAKKTERTKNYTQQQAKDRKIVGEDITNVGNAVHVVSEGVGVVKSVIKPFKKRYIKSDEMLYARNIENMIIDRSIRSFHLRRRRLNDI